MKIVVPQYNNLHDEEYKYFEKFNTLKRNGKYGEALILLDFIESNCYTIERRFVSKIKVNKQRSVIYRKLKDKKLQNYYLVLSEISGMINSAYYSITGEHMLHNYYFTDKFCFDDVKINAAIREYVSWFKLIYPMIKQAVREIDIEMHENYSKYEYYSSRDLTIYLYSTNENLLKVLRLLDDNPFKNYYKKHVLDIN